MIFNALITVIYNIFSFALDKFPAADPFLSNIANSWLYQLKLMMAPYNWFFPVDTVFQLFNASMTLIVGMIAVRGISWILAR